MKKITLMLLFSCLFVFVSDYSHKKEIANLKKQLEFERSVVCRAKNPETLDLCMDVADIGDTVLIKHGIYNLTAETISGKIEESITHNIYDTSTGVYEEGGMKKIF